MKIKDLLNHRAGVEVLAKAKFGDGALSYQAMKTLKAYNKGIDVYQDLGQSAQKEIQAEEDEEAKKALIKDWNRKLAEAAAEDTFFTAPRVFKVSELIPEGKDNPNGFESAHLLDLDALGILGE